MKISCKLFDKIKFNKFLLNHIAAAIIFVISMQLTGCGGAVKIAPYPPNTFSAYNNHVTNGDLHIAVQPMTDIKEQEKYFSVVLTDVGILPVYVITENRSDTHRYMLRDDQILLKNRVTNTLYPKPLLTDAADDSNLNGAKRAAAITTGVGVFVAPVIGLGSVFTGISLARKSEKIKSIQDNMFDKTFLTQSLLPGKTAGGFAYFKVADGKIDPNNNPDVMKESLLTVKVTDEATQENKDFKFDLK